MNQAELNQALIPILKRVRVVPVLTIADAATAVPLARALVAGGLTHLEITLRTPAARDAMRRIAAEVEGAVVGAGTVLTPQHADDAMAVGATFLVSPGATSELYAAAKNWRAAWLPGVATASEAMTAQAHGLRLLKFFPAEASGGVPALKSLAAPLADIMFCPTGGVGPANLARYLDCANVVCVGGSWVAPDKAIAAADWPEITRLAKAASTAS
jgi:2-dehydro-3-deoxyphosphogluconate aldolase / (4S)-4-hydroxy-2-oxoglutarate aldolase